MVYMKLASPVREFDNVRIKEVSFFDTNGEANLDKALSFKYQVYKKEEDKYISFYEKYISISDQYFISSILGLKNQKLSAYDMICKKLLEYLISQSIEVGTVELE